MVVNSNILRKDKIHQQNSVRLFGKGTPVKQNMIINYHCYILYIIITIIINAELLSSLSLDHYIWWVVVNKHIIRSPIVRSPIDGSCATEWWLPITKVPANGIVAAGVTVDSGCSHHGPVGFGQGATCHHCAMRKEKTFWSQRLKLVGKVSRDVTRCFQVFPVWKIKGR